MLPITKPLGLRSKCPVLGVSDVGVLRLEIPILGVRWLEKMFMNVEIFHQRGRLFQRLQIYCWESKIGIKNTYVLRKYIIVPRKELLRGTFYYCIGRNMIPPLFFWTVEMFPSSSSNDIFPLSKKICFTFWCLKPK